MIEVLRQNIGLIFKIDFVAFREIFAQHMESGTLIFFLFNENNYIFLLFADENLLTFVTMRFEHFFVRRMWATSIVIENELKRFSILFLK